MTSQDVAIYSRPLYVESFRGCLPLMRRDISSLTYFAPITIAYHFKDLLDPEQLCQSLAAALNEYPQFTGRLVSIKGIYHNMAGHHEAAITVVEVPSNVVALPMQWLDIIRQHPLRVNQIAGAKLFQAVLLKSTNPSDGCSLLATFDHGLADASTCGTFMAQWSRLHEKAFGQYPRPPSCAALPQDYDIPVGESGFTARRFHFYNRQLTALKDMINAENGAGLKVTTNDVLVAMVACALIPHPAPATGDALIVMMADSRGRGEEVTYMGNAARSIALAVPWEALLSRDLAVVTTAVREAIVKGLDDLERRIVAEGDAPMPRPDEPFMDWNSWARASQLLEASFGSDILMFDWVNLRAMHDPRAVVVIPVAPGGGLALQVTLPYREMAYLRQLWSTFMAPTAAA
eukprot:GGOE01009295.1.p1 GENE.GGOE01009295.1~~GGOE01009295.1.p1  ORF type:complete len:403 (+),score=92.55 GGOE01009295.1:29-1237(+)